MKSTKNIDELIARENAKRKANIAKLRKQKADLDRKLDAQILRKMKTSEPETYERFRNLVVAEEEAKTAKTKLKRTDENPENLAMFSGNDFEEMREPWDM